MYIRVPRLNAPDWTAIDGESLVQKLDLTRATEDQQGAIREFVLGRDVFVGLPTDSGKSLCFVFDILRARAGSVVV